jgi:hypothetical protein
MVPLEMDIRDPTIRRAAGPGKRLPPPDGASALCRNDMGRGSYEIGRDRV